MRFSQLLKKAVIAILLVEALLQFGSFYKWYIRKIDSSPTVLCIADYKAAYPSLVQRELTNSEWKIIDATHPRLTSSEAVRIVESFQKRSNLKAVYVTLGTDSTTNQKDKVIWDDSFEWKFRSFRLLQALRKFN